MNILGNKIKELRIKAGYTQEELATIMRSRSGLATDRAVVSRWETGKQEPTITALKVLAFVLGVTMDDLNGSGIHPKPLTPEEMNLLEQFRLANPEQQESILTLLRASLQIGK